MRKQRNTDHFEKYLRIGARYNGDHFELLDGRSFPKLSPGSVVEIVVDPQMIQSVKDRNEFLRENSVTLVPQSTDVVIGISPNSIDSSRAEELIRSGHPYPLCKYLLVEIRLQEELRLWIRGDQKAWLDECLCQIPALNRTATSLNDAYTIISEHYETSRRTHTANVFTRTWARINGQWQYLDELRLNAISRHIATLASR